VYRAILARLLCLAKLTAIEATMGILLEAEHITGELSLPQLMTSIETNHLAHNPLLSFNSSSHNHNISYPETNINPTT
jgi:hypothetical protein